MLKKFVVAMFVCLIASSVVSAQEVSNLYLAGASYNPSASPAVAGSALYAHAVSPDSANGMYAFTAIDVIPNTLRPFTVTSNIGVGIAERVATIDGVSIFIPTSAGISWNGMNTGWQWSGGVGIPFKIANSKNGGGWYLMPTGRFLKSSVSNGTGYQVIGGLLFGWGK